MAALSDPEVRRAMDERAQSDEAGVLRYLAGWARLVVAETFAPENREFEGRTVGEVAAGLGDGPVGRHVPADGGRPPPDRLRRAHPRVRRRLGGQGRDLA